MATSDKTNNFSNLNDANPAESSKQNVSLVRNHYNSLVDEKLDDRKQSRIFHLRNINNWVKSMLFADYLDLIRSEMGSDHSIASLDMCCGKGGDLIKWKIGRISHLICVDVADAAVSACRERYMQMLDKERAWAAGRSGKRPHPSNISASSNLPIFSAEFHVADCGRVRLLDLSHPNDHSSSSSSSSSNPSWNGVSDSSEEPAHKLAALSDDAISSSSISKVLDATSPASESVGERSPLDSLVPRVGVVPSNSPALLDIASCQFSLHYMFESAEQADCAVRNLAERLRPGGYFICTIPDANEIMKRLRKSESGHRVENEIYHIEMDAEFAAKPPMVGARYHFYLEDVVDCPEYLIHLPFLTRLARRHGLEISFVEAFSDYFSRKSRTRDGLQLLRRMQALKEYRRGDASRGPLPASHYESAENYCIQNSLPPFEPLGTISRAEWEVFSIYLVVVFRKQRSFQSSTSKPSLKPATSSSMNVQIEK